MSLGVAHSKVATLPRACLGIPTLPSDVAFLNLAAADDALLVLELGYQSGWDELGPDGCLSCPNGAPRLQVLTLEGVPLQQLVLDPPPSLFSLQKVYRGAALGVRGGSCHVLMYYHGSRFHGIRQEVGIAAGKTLTDAELKVMREARLRAIKEREVEWEEEHSSSGTLSSEEDQEEGSEAGSSEESVE